MVDVRNQLVSMFDDVVKKAATEYSKTDKARLTINHSDLDTEVFVHLQDLQNLTGEAIMNRFERVLNSHKDMRVDDSFDISVGLLKVQKGGAKPRGANHLFPHLDNTKESCIKKKTCIVEIVCSEGEYICAAKAIAVLQAKESMRRENYKNFIKKIKTMHRRPEWVKKPCINFID